MSAAGQRGGRGAAGLRFHHLVLAVRRPGDATRLLAAQGYAIGEPVHDPLQKVNLIFCRSDDAPDVEIVYPGEEPSPLVAVLNRFQSGIYHLCYESDDVAATLTALEAQGLRALCVADPTPAVLFDGAKVSFYQIPDFGLIEIIDRGPTAG